MDDNDGSMVLGFFLGFFLPCIGVIVGMVLPGSRTTTGSILGFCVNMLLWLCTGLVLTVVRIALSS